MMGKAAGKHGTKTIHTELHHNGEGYSGTSGQTAMGRYLGV